MGVQQPRDFVSTLCLLGNSLLDRAFAQSHVGVLVSADGSKEQEGKIKASWYDSWCIICTLEDDFFFILSSFSHIQRSSLLHKPNERRSKVTVMAPASVLALEEGDLTSTVLRIY